MDQAISQPDVQSLALTEPTRHRASTVPTPPVAATGVLPSRVSVPSGAIW